MRRTQFLASAISTAALVAAIAALATAYWYDPAIARLGGYDFTTPEAAYKSHLQMKANADIGAMLALESLESGRRAEEMLESFEVHKEAEWEGRKVLFVSCIANGVRKYDTPSFEKDAERGQWIPKGTPYISSLDKDLSPVEEAMKSWRELGKK
jgi:hypothetical protein